MKGSAIWGTGLQNLTLERMIIFFQFFCQYKNIIYSYTIKEIFPSIKGFTLSILDSKEKLMNSPDDASPRLIFKFLYNLYYKLNNVFSRRNGE